MHLTHNVDVVCSVYLFKSLNQFFNVSNHLLGLLAKAKASTLNQRYYSILLICISKNVFLLTFPLKKKECAHYIRSRGVRMYVMRHSSSFAATPKPNLAFL